MSADVVLNVGEGRRTAWKLDLLDFVFLPKVEEQEKVLVSERANLATHVKEKTKQPLTDNLIDEMCFEA
jgi:hypothetical protein